MACLAFLLCFQSKRYSLQFWLVLRDYVQKPTLTFKANAEPQQDSLVKDSTIAANMPMINPYQSPQANPFPLRPGKFSRKPCCPLRLFPFIGILCFLRTRNLSQEAAVEAPHLSDNHIFLHLPKPPELKKNTSKKQAVTLFAKAPRPKIWRFREYSTPRKLLLI